MKEMRVCMCVREREQEKGEGGSEIERERRTTLLIFYCCRPTWNMV